MYITKGYPIYQSSSNQSNEFGLSINQFNPKASKNPIDQVLGARIDWLIAAYHSNLLFLVKPSLYTLENN